MSIRPTTAALLCAIACTDPVPSVPAGAQITCEANLECPAGWSCKTQLGRCVPLGSEDVAPVLVEGSASVTPALAGAGARLEARFELDEELLAPPEVRFGSNRFVFEANEGRRWTFSYVVAGTEPEGAATVLLTATDRLGNVARDLTLGAVTLDYTAPAVSSAVVSYVPDAANPLGIVTAATIGTRILVSVVAAEALDPSATPVLTLTAGDVPLGAPAPALRHDDGSAAFEVTVPDGAPDGTYVPTLAWRDRAGNASTTATFSTPPVRVRTSTPVLAVDQAKVTYLRSPWGNAAAEDLGRFTIPAGPYFALAPADPLTDVTTLPAGTFTFAATEVARLRLWGDAGRTVLVGTAAPGPDGAWPRQRFAALDGPALWVTGLDPAGNESAPVRLENAEWVATPNPPASGTSPHLLETTTYASTILAKDALVTTPASAPGADGDATVTVAAAAWRPRAPTGAQPGVRFAHAIAYDSARGRLVVFGGFGGSQLQDTWEWDGSAWADRTPPGTKPRARTGAATAYDAARGRVVLFGGNVAGIGQVRDLWEWDGSAWVDRTPAGAPSGPAAAAPMVYDAARGRVVLVGASGTSRTVDTWEWDGSVWTNRTPAGTKPPARFGDTLAYDAARSRVVLFGGNGFQDFWEWDGSTWENRTPAGPRPGARNGHGVAYDAARATIVVFGGRVGGAALADTWEWDGTRWLDRTPPGEGPGARDWHGLAYDAARGRVVLFGGRSDVGPPFLQDTWTWDGSVWTKLTPSAAVPTGRTGHALAHDVARRRVVMFGGQSGGDLGDTWEWDGAAWADRTAADAGPGARADHTLAYDAARGRVVLFGGSRLVGSLPHFLGDTWEWDGSLWVNRTAAGTRPPARRRAAMAYDAARRRVVLFGGAAGGRSTWEWDGSTWAERATAGTRPGERFDHAMAYDSARQRIVLFGGSSLGETAGRLQDTWEWDGATWVERTPAGAKPSARIGHAMAYDAERQRTVLNGGYDGAYLQDLWEWDGAAWVDRTPSGTGPGPRAWHALAYDATRRRVVWVGAGADSRNTWEWDHPPSLQAAIQFTPSVVGTRLSAAALTGLRVRAHCGGAFSPFGASDTGATLHGWASGGPGLFGGTWAPLASNDAGVAPTAPRLAPPPAALLDWTSSSADDARRFLLERDGLLSFQCRPSGVSGTGAAQVALDYAEVRVRYRTE